MDRRRFLFGLGGVAVALPVLEGLSQKTAKAADAQKFAVFVRQANGVVQKQGTEPERYFPDAIGPISDATFPADRAISEIKGYIDKTLLVRGVSYAFPGNGCGHSGGGNQCLTAAKVSVDPAGNKSLAMGESIDNRIARQLSPGKEPLTLYAGRMSGYINEVLSYRGAKDLRAAERNPYNAYTRLFGLPDASAAAVERKALMRKSVNDVVRTQMKALLAKPQLSTGDRERLDLHFSSIRDLEIMIATKLPDPEINAMKAMVPNVANPDYIVEIAKMQSSIIALAAASGMIRAATLQIGDGNDGTEFTIGGVRYPRFHQISHRIFSDGSEGDPIPDAVGKHHQIDRLHLQMFKVLLDKLAAYKLPTGGTLLDIGCAILTNDLATGPPHSYTNLPFVIVGSLGGYLKQGQYVDAGKVYNNKIWNTIGAGVGCTNNLDGTGGPLDSFGDPSLAKGNIPAMLK
jgi:hypothetical protein